MAVHWFPGHMHRARKKIKEAMPNIDLVIEVMDARIPFSSENPLVSELRGKRPCIKVLNKSDLADPATTRLWQEYLEREQGVKAQAVTTKKPAQVKGLVQLCRKLVPGRGEAGKPIRVMIMGIPNVGKSTIINTLAGKAIAKVGDEPAVTRQQQLINIGKGIVLSDTPGILWPRFENPNSGYRLAITGAVKNTAMEFEDVALYAVDFLAHHYPEALKARYKLKELSDNDQELLEAIARKRGCLRAGGIIELHRAAEILIHDIRAGALGLLSFETPEMVEAERPVEEEEEPGEGPVEGEAE